MWQDLDKGQEDMNLLKKIEILLLTQIHKREIIFKKNLASKGGGLLKLIYVIQGKKVL